ncbi:hypothetical protein POTG_04212 [Paenibacillus sp. oral taxon 786 str. D14]|uniref:hypothetical protein n=1 Tax=Paenibacillus sp. oral taxon 786 TaxID=652715 RepID=UPI0001AFD550|nr:hypothetical protein POTG_04212 [Paenibacillus sp. oral taxon 786 str. D14]
MKIGFVLFNGITFLDFIGFYDVIYRLNLFEEKGTTWDICGLSEEISDELGLTIKPEFRKCIRSMQDAKAMAT